MKKKKSKFGISEKYNKELQELQDKYCCDLLDKVKDNLLKEQKENKLSQKFLIKVASSTLDACEHGNYTTFNGKHVVFGDELDTAIIDTAFISSDVPLELGCENEEFILPTIEVTDETTAIAGKRLSEENVVVLNFASATNPGGGFLRGAKAQEEDLCRVSGLYSCLTRGDLPYFNRNKECVSSFYTNNIIYSPDVPVIKDEKYSWLDDLYKISIVTCPAPYVKGLDGNQIVSKEISDIFDSRIKRVLTVMSVMGHNNIILGAWGCGAFGNSPELVASAFKKVLQNNFGFEKIVFAIPDRNSSNFIAFTECFK